MLRADWLIIKGEQGEIVDELQKPQSRATWKTVLAVAGVAVGAVAAVNAYIAWRTPVIQNLLSGAFDRYPARFGAMAYAVAGSGSPVLMLHGLGAGNSMNEWSANWDALAQNHTVYAFDFPGWGLSDQPDQLFTAEDYIEAIAFSRKT